ncbi:hypothetical protein [Pararobbsia alpina]|uniref:Uncharacterized protein n=1 Tax=Pararobbsia alpina TaxID=621374 RepID=A0A6S7B237_9BURK|nr:hypothetical protein [Pararobbsia alpina]CAB3784613.1 hypothetical protein LMG28138_01844 [Pararobbsia alpina]
MSDIENGGQAFPWCGDLNETPFISLGATLRDYFAVRAPAEIPDWFKHAPATSRPVIPVPHASLTSEQYKEWDGLDEWLELSDVSNEVREFHAKYKAAIDAAYAWDRDQEIARYFAWRWRYADSMLKARQA